MRNERNAGRGTNDKGIAHPESWYQFCSIEAAGRPAGESIKRKAVSMTRLPDFRLPNKQRISGVNARRTSGPSAGPSTPQRPARNPSPAQWDTGVDACKTSEGLLRLLASTSLRLAMGS
jgi:hypothetical protein